MEDNRGGTKKKKISPMVVFNNIDPYCEWRHILW